MSDIDGVIFKRKLFSTEMTWSRDSFIQVELESHERLIINFKNWENVKIVGNNTSKSQITTWKRLKASFSISFADSLKLYL